MVDIALSRYYLTVKAGEIPKKDEVYEAFKEYARAPATIQAGMEALVKNLRDFAGYFCAMALGHERDPGLKLAFRDLRELKADVVYPLLLELYYDYANGILPLADVTMAVRLVESYVFRRAVCEMPTNSLNKVFAAFGRALKKDYYLESLQAHFLALTSYRGSRLTTSSSATCKPVIFTPTALGVATGCVEWKIMAVKNVSLLMSTPSNTFCPRTRIYLLPGKRR